MAIFYPIYLAAFAAAVSSILLLYPEKSDFVTDDYPYSYKTYILTAISFPLLVMTIWRIVACIGFTVYDNLHSSRSIIRSPETHAKYIISISSTYTFVLFLIAFGLGINDNKSYIYFLISKIALINVFAVGYIYSLGQILEQHIYNAYYA